MEVHVTCAGTITAAVLSIDNSALVTDFIYRKDLTGITQKAVELVRELFPQLREIKLELSRDPEECAEWIILRVTSAASRAELTPAYRRYISRWVSETPADKRHFVRLSYTGA